MDTQTDGGCGIDAVRVPGDKQYFWGLDVGDSKGDTGVTAHCHRDTEGVLIIDKIEYLGRDTQNQGLAAANQGL